MSILSGRAIVDAIGRGEIDIDPFDERQLNPASYDLRLGNKVVRYRSSWWTDTVRLDARKMNMTYERSYGPGEMVQLNPGELYLMHTAELVCARKHVPILDGKALDVETEIPTPTGWKRMGDIQPGDLVYGSDGRPTRVTAALTPFVSLSSYVLTFKDGTTITADAEHEWYVEPTDAKPSVRTTAQLLQRANKRQAIFRVPAVSIEGDERVLPIDPYVLGVWLGDGTAATASVTLRAEDVAIVEEMRRSVIVREMEQVSGAIRYSIGPGDRVQETSFYVLLRKNGLLGNKHIPEVYLRASKAQRLALLQGLMDTDGTVHRDDQASITLCDAGLIQQVDELLRSLGVVTYYDERPAKIEGRTVGTAYRLTWRALPEHFRLPRQVKKVRSTERWLAGARRPLRGITSITPAKPTLVRCISVESPDGLFLASRAFILTHNSSIGRLGICVHLTAGFGDPGFDGQYTLEVTCVHPVKVYVGMRFCQIRFHEIVGEIEDYSKKGHYTGSAAVGAVPSMSWKQFQEDK